MVKKVFNQKLTQINKLINKTKTKLKEIQSAVYQQIASLTIFLKSDRL